MMRYVIFLRLPATKTQAIELTRGVGGLVSMSPESRDGGGVMVRRSLRAGLVLILAASVVGLTAAPALGLSTTRRVSVSNTGAQASGNTPGISANGRYIAYFSDSTNLIPAGTDTNNSTDVFVYDRQTRQVVRVSVRPDGSEGFPPYLAGFGGEGLRPAVSADGRFVAFFSFLQLVPADDNEQTDIYVHDRDLDGDGIFDEAGAMDTVRVNVASDGTPASPFGSYYTEISADGRYVAFGSDASNLVAGDGNGTRDVFVHDRDTDSDGVFDEPGAIATVQMSVATDGTKGNQESTQPRMTADGRYVAFIGGSTNLVSGDSNGRWDVFVRDRDTDQDGVMDEAGSVETFRGSPTPAGGEFDVNVGYGHDISPDGHWIGFVVPSAPSGAVSQLLHVFDVQTRTTQFVRNLGSSSVLQSLAMSGDGSSIVTNEGSSVVLVDRATGSSETISAFSGGSSAPGVNGSVSEDARFVAFASDSGLVLGDTNSQADVYLRDRNAPPLTAPAAPADVTAVAGDHSATVSWSAPDDGGSPIQYYTVTASPPDAAPVTVNSPNLTTTISGLTSGVSYTFTVTATNSVGTGPFGTSNAVTPTGGPALEISNIVELADPVGRFERFEADIELSRTYADPFDPDEVSVDVTFTAPSGATSSMPAFWFQDFEVRAGTETFEVYDPVGDPSWRVRFAPAEVGTYSYVVHAVDGLGGSADSAPTTFEVAASANQGFVRVDESDGRFFRFDRGAPYVPLGHNAGFDTTNPPLNGTSYYEALFDESFAPQENWTRIWMTDFNRSALEWGPGHWSGFYDGVGAYSLPAAWRMDRILGSAEAHGLYVQLVLNDHGQYNSRPDGRWQVRCNDPSDGCTPGEPGYDPGNPYSDAVGGPVAADRPEQFFSNAQARDLFERRLRYVVARWGGYTNVLAWELFNEVQFVGSDAHNPYNDPAMWADVLDWHGAMASYLATIDPNDHLVTTSSDPAPAGDDLGSVSGIDIVQVHDYTVPSEARDASIAAFASQLQAQHEKPVIIGEFGVGGSNPEAAFDPVTFSGTTAEREHLSEGTNLHNAVWTGALSASGSMTWWWDNYMAAEPSRNRVAPDFPLAPRVFPAIDAYLDGEDWATLDLDHSALSTSSDLFGVGLNSDERAFLWVRDAENEFGTGARPGDFTGRVISGSTVEIPGMADGNYRVSVFETYGAGGAIDSFPVTISGGPLHIDVPDFIRDMALKVEPIPPADLEVTTGVQAIPAYAGYDLAHTVRVRNLGPNSATDAVMTDVLPAGAVFASVVTDQGSCTQSAGTVSCDLGDLANAETATITIVSTPTVAASTTFSATASTTATDNEPDNDDDSSTVDVGGQTCTIVGTQVANSPFVGTTGPDVICGLGGSDQISGLEGADVLIGGSGNDSLLGGNHDDWLIGGAGNDGLNGGSGTDLARFDASPAAVIASIGTLSATGEGSDGMASGSIEGLVGSSFSDTLSGNNNNQSLSGLGGTDSLNGSGGNDILEGGGQNDTLNGGGGDDWLYGQAGNDGIDGGVGKDLARYDDAPGPVTANLTTLTSTGDGSDTFVTNSLEGLVGSPYDDDFTGGSGADRLFPLGGNDVLRGLAGADRLEGGEGNDSINGGAANDTLLGLAGNDLFDGGVGTDSVTFAIATGPVTANLTTLAASGEGNDTFVVGTVENLLGSPFDDSLTGDGLNNRLEGVDGNDSLFGLAGVDTLLGGNGNDLLDGGPGNDTLNGGTGTDSCTQGGGGGSVSSCNP